MRQGKRMVGSLLLSAAFLLPLATVGCAEHHYYRAYDPDDNQYHQWDNREQGYYRQWTVETHRDADRDYRRLSKDEQKQYWEWRKDHGDHDRDRDDRRRDRDHDHDHDHDHDRDHN